MARFFRDVKRTVLIPILLAIAAGPSGSGEDHMSILAAPLVFRRLDAVLTAERGR
jgi:hypothetical protein